MEMSDCSAIAADEGAVRREMRQRGSSCVWVCIFKGKYVYICVISTAEVAAAGSEGEVSLALWFSSSNNQQSPSVVMTTSTSLLPISSSAVARETRSVSAW